MSRDDIIRMAREADMDVDDDGSEWGPIITAEPADLERFFHMAQAAERKSRPHSLGHGEMELSLRREHKGELLELRHRFTAEQVMHDSYFMVVDAASSMDDAMDAAIRARGQE